MNRHNLIKGALVAALLASFVAICAVPARSQDEELIKPSRPDVAEPADFQPPGVLQIEFGGDAVFRAEEFRDQQLTLLTLRYAVSRRLLLDVDLEAPIAERAEQGMRRETGVGDTRVGAQVLLVEEDDDGARPAFALAYTAKLPTASAARGLGTGRTDHRVAALVSKKLGAVDVDFNVAYLNEGRQDSARRASGGEAALSVMRDINDKFGLDVEISGQSEDDFLPPGIYPLGALIIKASERVHFDVGVRFGIGAQAPRAGVFAGVTIGVGRRK